MYGVHLQPLRALLPRQSISRLCFTGTSYRIMFGLDTEMPTKTPTINEINMRMMMVSIVTALLMARKEH